MSTAVGSTTLAYPGTTWPHQRRLAVVGDRLVAIYTADGLGATVKWSPASSSSWTDYSAPIPGWSQGSFATYQDAGGTWRAITVWVDTGEFGVRAAGWLYVMVGTFAADLSTLTWGPAVALQQPGDAPTFAQIDAADVDVVPDGSGGIAFVAWSMIGAFGGLVRSRRVTISSAGTMTFDPANTTIGGPWSGLVTITFPTVAIDPVTRHAGIAYSTGQTVGQAGPIFGSRFRKFTYLAGAWTPGPERVLDATLIPAGSSNNAFTFTCRWDPKTGVWVIGGLVAATAELFVWQRDLADIASTRVLFHDASPTSLDSGSLAIDPSTGNIALFGSRHTSLGSAYSLHQRLLTRIDGSTVSAAGPVEIDSSIDIAGVSSLGTAGAFNLLFGQGGTGTWRLSHLRIPLNVAPNAPTLLTPIGSIFVNVDNAQRFTWAFIPVTGGDTQSALKVEYRVVGTGPWTSTGWVSNAASRWDFPSGTFSDAVDYEWRATVKGATGIESPVSASGFFTGLGTPSAPSITAPADHSTQGATATVTWSTPAQDSFEVRVVGDDGTGSPNTADVIFDTSELLEPDTRSYPLSFPTAGVVVHIEVRVRDSGTWSDWADIAVTTSFAGPGLVTVSLAYLAFVAGALIVTTDPGEAVGLQVSVVNLAGDLDPLAVEPDTTHDLHVDFGSDTGGDY